MLLGQGSGWRRLFSIWRDEKRNPVEPEAHDRAMFVAEAEAFAPFEKQLCLVSRRR